MVKQKQSNTTEATISDIIERRYQGQVTKLRLNLVEENMFSGQTEYFSVPLTHSQTVDGDDFKKDKLEKAFKVISEQTGTDIEVPKTITLDTLNDAINDVKGETIEVVVGRRERKERDSKNKQAKDITVGYYTYYSLYEDYDFMVANSTINELVKENDSYGRGTILIADPLGFQIEVSDFYFSDGVKHEAEMLEETNTRIGFARMVYKYLHSDSNDNKFIQDCKERLEKYMKENKDNQGEFVGRTGDIIEKVGVFSDQAKNARYLDDITVMRLEKLVSNQKASGRAWLGSLRLVFSLKNKQKTYRTHALRESKIPNNEEYKVTFNPKDTDFREFSKFTEPLYRLGALTKDDLKEMRQTTSVRELVNKIYEVIEREQLVARISISERGRNYYANLLGFEYRESQDDIEEETTYFENGIDSHTEAVAPKIDNNTKDSKDAEEKANINDKAQSKPKRKRKKKKEETNFIQSHHFDDVSDEDLPF